MTKPGLRQLRTHIAIRFAEIFLATSLPTVALAQEMSIPPRFEAAGNFHHGVAAVKEDGLWGLIDRKGEWIVRPTYDGVTVGGNGLFGVEHSGLWGFVDVKGRTVIQLKYEAVGEFEGGVAPAKRKGLWGYITTRGEINVPFEYAELGGRENDTFTAKGEGGWAVLRQGKPIQGNEFFDDVIRYYSVSEGTIVAKVEDGEALLLLGTAEWSATCLSIKKMSQGLSAVSCSKGKWGYLDRNAEFRWEDRFEEAGSFTEGLAPVKAAGKWGYIDRIGNFAVAPSYDAAFSFREGLAVIRIGELRGFLKNDPQRGIYEFIKPTYQDAFRFTEGLAPVKVGEKWGYVSSGTEIEDVVNIEPLN